MYKVYVIDTPIYSDDEHFFEPSTMCVDPDKATHGREASEIKFCKDVYKEIKDFIVEEHVYYGTVEKIEGEKSLVIYFNNYNELKNKDLDFYKDDTKETITMDKTHIKVIDTPVTISSKVSYTYQNRIKKYDNYIILFLNYYDSIADNGETGMISVFLNKLNDKIEDDGADTSQIRNHIISPLTQKVMMNNSRINAGTANPIYTSPMTIDLPYNARELLLYLQLKKGDINYINQLKTYNEDTSFLKAIKYDESFLENTFLKQKDLELDETINTINIADKIENYLQNLDSEIVINLDVSGIILEADKKIIQTMIKNKFYGKLKNEIKEKIKNIINTYINIKENWNNIKIPETYTNDKNLYKKFKEKLTVTEDKWKCQHKYYIEPTKETTEEKIENHYLYKTFNEIKDIRFSFDKDMTDTDMVNKDMTYMIRSWCADMTLYPGMFTLFNTKDIIKHVYQIFCLKCQYDLIDSINTDNTIDFYDNMFYEYLEIIRTKCTCTDKELFKKLNQIYYVSKDGNKNQIIYKFKQNGKTIRKKIMSYENNTLDIIQI